MCAMHFRTGGLDIARAERRVKGEDANAAGTMRLRGMPSVHYFAVFDGHGGAQASKYCARMMSMHIADAFNTGSGVGADTLHERLALACTQAFEDADLKLREMNSTHGTTATCVFVSAHAIDVANVGDSEAYLFTPDGKAHPLIEDHRVDTCALHEQTRVINAGGKLRQARDARGMPRGPMRVFPGGLAMTRTIGDADASTAVIHTPGMTHAPYPREGGVIVLASDGLWDYTTLHAVGSLVRASAKPTLGMRWLSQSLLRLAAEQNKLIDDVTIVCIAIKPTKREHPPSSSAAAVWPVSPPALSASLAAVDKSSSSSPSRPPALPRRMRWPWRPAIFAPSKAPAEPRASSSSAAESQHPGTAKLADRFHPSSTSERFRDSNAMQPSSSAPSPNATPPGLSRFGSSSMSGLTLARLSGSEPNLPSIAASPVTRAAHPELSAIWRHSASSCE